MSAPQYGFNSLYCCDYCGYVNGPPNTTNCPNFLTHPFQPSTITVTVPAPAPGDELNIPLLRTAKGWIHHPETTP